MKTLGLLVGVVAFLGWAGARSSAAESASALQSDAHGWLDLQPGPSLAGWTRVPIPPTNSLGRQQWHVDRPGLLVCNGDTGHEMLRFDRELTNGIFHVEFRFSPVTSGKKQYNSGVFIRNSADGRIWHQAQLAMDGGYLFGDTPVDGTLKRFKTSPAERRMKPAGRWNTIEVTARGPVLSVWLNGAETCVYDHCGVSEGFIALESEGYRIEFRHVRYKPLD